MENSNSNNDINRLNKFFYTDEDMAGITIIKKGSNSINELVDKLHDSKLHEDVFEEIVNVLLNELCFNAGGKKIRVVECEVYYDDKAAHSDPFLYGHEKQIRKLEWCFHYSGIDLTIGNGDEIMGGILIRSIYDLGAKEYITGPLKSSNYILNSTHGSSLASADNSQSLFLETYDYGDDKDQIVKSIRIGLDKGKILNEHINSTKGEPCYYKRLYRYAIKSFSKEKKYIDDSLKNERRLNSIINNEP